MPLKHLTLCVNKIKKNGYRVRGEIVPKRKYLADGVAREFKMPEPLEFITF